MSMTLLDPCLMQALIMRVVNVILLPTFHYAETLGGACMWPTL